MPIFQIFVHLYNCASINALLHRHTPPEVLSYAYMRNIKSESTCAPSPAVF